MSKSSRKTAEILLDEYDMYRKEHGLPTRNPKLSLDAVHNLVLAYVTHAGRFSKEPPPLNVPGFLQEVLLQAPVPGTIMTDALTSYAQQIAREQLHTHTAREVFRDGSRNHWVRWNHRPRLWTEDPSRMRRPDQQEDCRLAAVDIQVRGSSEKNPLHKQQLDSKLRRAIEKSQSGNMMLLP